MAEVLARLGQTRQANNLNQIAKHLNQGTLIVDPELEEDLKRAVAEVAWMRATLMEALGVKSMILKGSQRSGAKALADHLMNDRDNDHVSCLELRDFSSDQLHGALSEMHAISKATQCKQFMFSLSLNPPQDHIATEQDFLEAADRAEQHLGLTDQPRAIVMHEKEGRRHAHVVWSRIDVDEMKAINLPHFKNKLRDLSRDLFLDHGWVLPDGLATYGNKSPLNFTLGRMATSQTPRA